MYRIVLKVTAQKLVGLRQKIWLA